MHDIEFDFEEDVDKAWEDMEARKASGASTKDEFADAYFREWASWFSLPCHWAKQDRPGMPVGLYGPQPFRRDYWGVAGKSAQQIDGTHRSDAELWQYIDPQVDFYVASVYVFYDDPGSIYYIAANIEENYQRTRRYGNKPVYAYEWLRYHDSNKKLAGRELAPYLLEAMAVVPYFCGAKGVVLWGWEPGRKGQYYANLPLFAQSLGRISDLSEQLARAELVIDEPAHVLWKEKRPLVRQFKLSDDQWVVLAVNPWQADDAQSSTRATCGTKTVELPLVGRHTGIFEVRGDQVTKGDMSIRDQRNENQINLANLQPSPIPGTPRRVRTGGGLVQCSSGEHARRRHGRRSPRCGLAEGCTPRCFHAILARRCPGLGQGRGFRRASADAAVEGDGSVLLRPHLGPELGLLQLAECGV